MNRSTQHAINLVETYSAHNYHPLPIVIRRARGVYVWDISGRRYFDFLSAYSALNQGHNHPKIIAAARHQMGMVTLTSRAFHNEHLGPFLKKLCTLTGTQRAIPMNTGAEAVETAIKAMRLWGYRRKGIKPQAAKIIVCHGNFHGRTTTISGFSSDPLTYSHFGPITPGFISVPYGDIRAINKVITRNTAGILFEPIQGEAGVIIPSRGWLKELRRLSKAKNVLMCADEIQTGFGRTGKLFACDHEHVKPDLLVLGKALSGGIYPVSAVCGSNQVLKLFSPGTHGSTYGGNPLACAIASAAIDVIIDEKLVKNAQMVGAYLSSRLKSLSHPALVEMRGKGLMLALEFKVPVRPLVERLMAGGLLAKETHKTIIRLAPPLILTEAQAEQAFQIIRDSIADSKI